MKRVPAVAVAACALAACTAQPPVDRFEAWRKTHPFDVEAYADFLRTEGVADIVPMRDLLRSGRRWKRCGADEFVVPPREAWQAMPATLRVVGELRGTGIIRAPVVASSFRTFAFNRCEGGSAKSRHLANNALDFDLDADAGQRLCDWWRRQGKTRGVGLGFYTPRRIHIDTAGFRTWGGDHTRKTSLCVVSG